MVHAEFLAKRECRSDGRLFNVVRPIAEKAQHVF